MESRKQKKHLLAQLMAVLSALFLVYHYATNYEEYHLSKSNQAKEEDGRDLLAEACDGVNPCAECQKELALQRRIFKALEEYSKHQQAPKDPEDGSSHAPVEHDGNAAPHGDQKAQQTMDADSQLALALQKDEEDAVQHSHLTMPQPRRGPASSARGSRGPASKGRETVRIEGMRVEP